MGRAEQAVGGFSLPPTGGEESDRHPPPRKTGDHHHGVFGIPVQLARGGNGGRRHFAKANSPDFQEMKITFSFQLKMKLRD